MRKLYEYLELNETSMILKLKFVIFLYASNRDLTEYIWMVLSHTLNRQTLDITNIKTQTIDMTNASNVPCCVMYCLLCPRFVVSSVGLSRACDSNYG